MARNSIAKSRASRDHEESRNPSWYVPVMLGFIVVGRVYPARLGLQPAGGRPGVVVLLAALTAK